MSQPIILNCESCGAEAPVLMTAHTGADGNRVEWPKATVKPDGIYFAISCPACGEREQCMARPGDND